MGVHIVIVVAISSLYGKFIAEHAFVIATKLLISLLNGAIIH